MLSADLTYPPLTSQPDVWSINKGNCLIRNLFIDQTSDWEVSGGYVKAATNMLYARKRPNFSDMKKEMKLIWCTNMSILFFLDQTQWITSNSSNWPNQMSPNGYLEPSIIHFSSQFLTRISQPSLLLIFGSGTSQASTERGRFDELVPRTFPIFIGNRSSDLI